MNKKGILTIGIIILIILISNTNQQTKTSQIKKGAAGESVIRTVSNSNPVYGEIVTVTLTATLVDTNGIEDEIVSIEENIPSWTYNLGSFNIKADTNRLSKLDMGLPGGVHTYTYTVTAPTSVSTLTFAGTYVIGEGPTRDDLTAVPGTPSITSKAPTCTPSLPCTSGGECKTVACIGGSCVYTNKADGTTCTGGTCQNGGCVQTPVYSCTGTIPSNANICSGDNTGLTANTPITLVSICGIPKCEYTCSSPEYQLSGGVCTSTSTCGDGVLNPGEQCDGYLLGGATCTSLGYTGGTLTCTASCAYNTASCTSGCTANSQCTSYTNSCNDGTCNIGTGECYSTPKADGTSCTGGTCQLGSCVSQQTCSSLGGVICLSGQSCDGGEWVSAPGTSLCCLGGACKTPAQTCEQRLKCEMWEECSDDGATCKYASWVYLIIIFMAILFMMNMIRR